MRFWYWDYLYKEGYIMREEKYTFVNKTTIDDGRVLYRILALRDFGNVKIGDLGGWIEKENNLSHDGNCWVADDACVYGNAVVRGDAYISGRAWVYDNANISGRATVSDYARVYDNASICGCAKVFDHARIHGISILSDYVHISGRAKIYGNAQVYGHTRVCDDAIICGTAIVSGNIDVYGDAHIFDQARVDYPANIGNGATISKISDCMIMGLTTDIELIPLTFYKTNDGITVSMKKYRGTIDDLKRRIEKMYGKTGECPNESKYLHHMGVIARAQSTIR